MCGAITFAFSVIGLVGMGKQEAFQLLGNASPIFYALAPQASTASAESVAHVWLIDPLARTLEVLRLESQRWVIAGTWSGHDVLRAEPFAAIELDLALLRDEPPTPPPP